MCYSPEGPGEGAGEPVLVLVDDHEALDLLDLVPQHVHQLLHKLRVSLILTNTINFEIRYSKDKSICWDRGLDLDQGLTIKAKFCCI